MAVKVDIKTAFIEFMDEMNTAVESRDFVPFAKKWFMPEGILSLYYRTEGLDRAQTVFQHIVPSGDDPTRKVVQFIYKVEGNTVYSLRRIESGQLPQPV